MKCPHCEYEDGWSGEKLEIIEGEYGKFFFMSNGIQMERQSGLFSRNTDKKDVYGCPSCNKLFMVDII